MKAIEKHRDSTLKGRMNSYVFKAKDVREQVDNLRREVNRVVRRFMVRHPCRSLERHGTDALQVQCLIDVRASQTYLSLQVQPPPDVVTTQVTTAVSYNDNNGSDRQDRSRDVTHVVQEVITRRRRSLSLRSPSMVRTNGHI